MGRGVGERAFGGARTEDNVVLVRAPRASDRAFPNIARPIILKRLQSRQTPALLYVLAHNNRFRERFFIIFQHKAENKQIAAKPN